MFDNEKIYNEELEFLKDGIRNGKNPYHTFTFSSIRSKYPESRIVVLRNLDMAPLRIYFNTDYRSPKIKDLRSNNNCSALFYNQVRRVQLRFQCKALIHYQNNISKKVWENTPLQSRKCYMGPFAPSQTLNEWHPNIPLEYLKTDPEKNHSMEGYINFVNIELKIIESDILQLHHDGHIRFQVKNRKKILYIAP